MLSDDPYWKAIDDLRVRVAQHDARFAVVETQIVSMMESQGRIEDKLSSLGKDITRMTNVINADLNKINTELSETRGGIRFGKYLLGTGITIVTMIVGVMKFFGY